MTSRLRLAGIASRIMSGHVSRKVVQVKVQVQVAIRFFQRAGRSSRAFLRSSPSDIIQSICDDISNSDLQVGRDAVFAGAWLTFGLGCWTRHGD